VAVVEVDTETGKVILRRVVTANDAGTIINPLLAGGDSLLPMLRDWTSRYHPPILGQEFFSLSSLLSTELYCSSEDRSSIKFMIIAVI
jgi:hypothetical protein